MSEISDVIKQQLRTVLLAEACGKLDAAVTMFSSTDGEQGEINKILRARDALQEIDN